MLLIFVFLGGSIINLTYEISVLSTALEAIHLTSNLSLKVDQSTMTHEHHCPVPAEGLWAWCEVIIHELYVFIMVPMGKKEPVLDRNVKGWYVHIQSLSRWTLIKISNAAQLIFYPYPSCIYQILQARFNSFTKDILTNEGRIRAIGNKANTLIKSGIDEDDTIATKCQELEVRWDELKEATNARTQVRVVFTKIEGLLVKLPLYLDSRCFDWKCHDLRMEWS